MSNDKSRTHHKIYPFYERLIHKKKIYQFEYSLAKYLTLLVKCQLSRRRNSKEKTSSKSSDDQVNKWKCETNGTFDKVTNIDGGHKWSVTNRTHNKLAMSSLSVDIPRGIRRDQSNPMQTNCSANISILEHIQAK